MVRQPPETVNGGSGACVSMARRSFGGGACVDREEAGVSHQEGHEGGKGNGIPNTQQGISNHQGRSRVDSGVRILRAFRESHPPPSSPRPRGYGVPWGRVRHKGRLDRLGSRQGSQQGFRNPPSPGEGGALVGFILSQRHRAHGGGRLSVIGYRLSVIGYRLSVIGYRLSVIGYWGVACWAANRDRSGFGVPASAGPDLALVIDPGLEFLVQPGPPSAFARLQYRLDFAISAVPARLRFRELFSPLPAPAEGRAVYR